MLLMSTAAELEANENLEVTSVFTTGKSFSSTTRETHYIHLNEAGQRKNNALNH